MGQNVGGYLRGPWWRYHSDEDARARRCFVVAWGHIVKQPKDQMHNDLRSIEFVIKTGRGSGRNEKHLVCKAYGETISAVVMRAMEKGDIVFVAGTWREYQYRNKKGDAMRYEAQVNFIVPLGLVEFLLELYSTNGVQQIVDNYRNADADVWESDD